MPSASAKLEKQASNEAFDPIKQIVTMVEKKVRNLEKRKAKLDAYKTDSQNGRELNEDQKNAVKKYDQVVEVLDFAKEMQKSFNSVIQDSVKLQKKVAKRELLERQQQELQRIKEILLIQDILNSMDGEDVRKDFLNETNGAVKLTEEELNGLDELYKVVNVERNPEESKSEFEQHLSTAAEHIQGLLDSKQKEVCGTSYKSLKETIMKVHCSGYFSKTESEELNEVEELNAVEAEIQDEAVPDVDGGGSAYTTEEYDVPPTVVERIPQSLDENSVLMQQTGVPPSAGDKTFYQAESTPLVYSEPTRPVQDVLSVPGNLNFLQESQIGIESHMDPATVIAHPVLPPGIPYPGAQYPTQQQASASQVLSTHHQQKPGEGVPPPPAGQRLTPTRMMTNTSAQSAVQQPVSVPNNISVSQPMQMQNPVNQAPDFDPARPIPTQTYTNQNFSSAIHPMMSTAVPPNFASVTLAHAPLPPQHIVSAGLVPRSTVAPPVVSDQNAMPMTVHSQSSGGLPSTTVLSQVNAQETKEHFAASREYQMAQQQQRPLDRESPPSVQSSLVTASSQFDRGETGYQNATNTSFGGRESYVDSTSYSSNLKRGLNSRGGGVPRGGSAQRGGSVASRGSRASYRN